MSERDNGTPAPSPHLMGSEPVAWTMKDSYGCDYITMSKHQAALWPKKTPLYAAQPAPAENVLVTVPCPCTLVQQDESCPVGYPSLICDACDGKGNINIMPPREAIERLRAYAHGSNDARFDTYDAADVIGYLEAMDTIRAALATATEGSGE